MFPHRAGWVDPPPPSPRPPSPPPWLATAGQKWLVGNLAKINENEEKRPHLGSLGVQAIPF